MPFPPHSPSSRRCLARLLVAAACMAAAPAIAGLVVMHGFADVTSALVWIQADAPGPVAVTWRVEGESSDRRLELAATAANDNVVVARLTGLAPGMRAAYRIAAGSEQRDGTVRAQPWWSKATDAQPLAFAIGSCFFLGVANPPWASPGYAAEFEIFGAIAAAKPDLMLWLGDNLYLQRPDFLDPASMAMHYRRQRAFAPLAPLLTAAPQLAIWDDHDYGPNDSDTSYVLKGEALRLFQRYWPNVTHGLPDTPGIFGFAQYGDVLFFLLDDRYHRSPNRWPDGADKTMFGARQLTWLKQALTSAPKTSLKIIAGGSQFWNRASRFEGWHHFGTEQRAFAEWLAEQKIDGVIFLSGDRHFGELLRIERPGTYPLYEFTSSPLTSRPPSRIDNAEKSNPDLVAGTLGAKRQFGMIRVTGAGNDRMIGFESHDSTGALLWRHEVRARDLGTPKTAAAAP